MRRIGVVALVCYLASIVVANWLVNHYGVVPVGFGLSAPAGVYAVGIAFTLRDITQRLLGRVVVVAAIFVGAGLSAFVSPQLAVASGVAFCVSELADFAIYTPLAEGGRLVAAVVLSNTVGALLDSWIFLTLAFHSLTFFKGQVVGKLLMTALAVPFVFAARRYLNGRDEVLSRHAHA